MVEDCVRRFGMQTVDLVFEQIKQEPFSLGQNKTGFIANFQYIFTPKNFQQYLERAQLRLKKAHKEEERAVSETSAEPTKSNGSWLDAYNENSKWRPEQKQ
jgi:hypothetical protein